jgi:hypothetical protein
MCPLDEISHHLPSPTIRTTACALSKVTGCNEIESNKRHDQRSWHAKINRENSGSIVGLLQFDQSKYWILHTTI